MADDAIRAEIPALLSVATQQFNKSRFSPQFLQQWGWRDGRRPKLSPNEVAEFVQSYAWPNEEEMALRSLFEGRYDVLKAVQIIHKARREKVQLKRDQADRTQNIAFEKAINRHGKKFHLVKRRMGRTVTTRELVSKFYVWKLSPEYEKWHERQREKKRKGQAKRLATLRPAEGQHNEYCELCLKDGKLLCCDGCERAYHLNCVRPVLLDVPEGDWFCSYCRDAAPKSLAIRSNRENLPDEGTLKSYSKPKKRPDGSRLKGDNGLPTLNDTRDVEEKNVVECMEKKNEPTTGIKTNANYDKPKERVAKRLTKKMKPTASLDAYNLSTDKSSLNDAISDITTESDSDGGADRGFQALLSKYVVATTPVEKRKKHSTTFEVNVGRSHYSSPSHYLEYLSSPCKGVVPLQLESTSSGRKRMRQIDA